MLYPTTETKRGNFGRYYPWSRALVLHALVGHGTMGLKCVPSYYTRGLGMGPWVEMCALVRYAWVGGKYTDDVWVESLEKTYDSLGM
jgi:hypothetical protein